MKRFTVKKVLGKSVLGEVFHAYDNLKSRDVAIKRLVYEPDSGLSEKQFGEAVERLRNEAKIAEELEHPNIASTYETIETQNGTFIVMEYAQGLPIQRWLKKGRRFSILEAVEIGEQIGLALDHAHESGIFHRDLNPENIFVDNTLMVKLTDFGIGKIEADALEKDISGSFLGTPAYSSPEQWMEEMPMDGRSDLYSAGVILYRLITGRLPFQSDNLMDLIGRIMTETPEPMRKLNPRVPEQLDAIIVKTLGRLPKDRYQTGLEMANELASVRWDISQRAANDPTEGILDQFLSQKEAAADGNEDRVIQKSLNFDTVAWVLEIIGEWEKKGLEQVNISELMDQLVNPPAYGDPFSGVLLADQRYLFFFHGGHIIQTIDFKTGQFGEEAAPSISDKLYTCDLFRPAGKSFQDLPLVLNAILKEGDFIHKDLDSAMLDVAGMIQKIEKDGLTGLIRFSNETGKIYLGYSRGTRLFDLKSEELGNDFPTGELSELVDFIKSRPFKADVYQAPFSPLIGSLRLLFKNTAITLSKQLEAATTHEALIKQKNQEWRPQTMNDLKQSVSLEFTLKNLGEIVVNGKSVGAEELFIHDFGYRFSNWFLFDFFLQLISSPARDGMKFVTSWMSEIETIHLNFPLEDETGRVRYFDFVTMNGDQKILHLAHRGKTGNMRELESCLENVTSIKRRLIKSGDIGGVFYVSSNGFSSEALDFFQEKTSEKKNRFSLSLLDSLGKQKGFVKVGKSAGFHFLLVSQGERGFRLELPEIY